MALAPVVARQSQLLQVLFEHVVTQEYAKVSWNFCGVTATSENAVQHQVAGGFLVVRRFLVPAHHRLHVSGGRKLLAGNAVVPRKIP